MIDFRLYLVTDRSQCPDEVLEDVVEAACAAGVQAVQLREKDLDTRDLLDLAVRIGEITSRSGTRLLINDRVDIASETHASGIHSPEDGFPPNLAKRLLGDRAIVGASVHSLKAAARAEAEKADFLTFGPVFPTASKEGAGAQGLEELQKVCSSVGIPVFAIGGITAANAGECIAHGARGVATVSAIMAAPDVIGAVSEFNTALDGL